MPTWEKFWREARMFLQATAICPSKLRSRSHAMAGFVPATSVTLMKITFFDALGRLSTLIKTESGEKVQTEDVEAAYATESAIREIGAPEKRGKLVALIVPERAACGDGVDAAEHAAIETASRDLPSYERISDPRSRTMRCRGRG